MTDQNVGTCTFNLLAAALGLEGFDLKECTLKLEKTLLNTREVLIVGDGIWGKGANEVAAMAAFKAMGGSVKKYIVYDCPIGTYVDGMGGLVYANAAALLGFEKPKEVRRKGFRTKQ